MSPPVLSIKPFRSASWDKVPSIELISRGLTDRQVSLYVHLCAGANNGEEIFRGVALSKGQTRFNATAFARRRKISDRSVRRDLRKLQSERLISIGKRAGNSIFINVVDPKFLPLLGELSHRRSPDSSPHYLLDMLCKMVGITQSDRLSAPDLSPDLGANNILKNHGVTIKRLSEVAAPCDRVELRVENIKNCVTQGENSLPDGSLNPGDAFASELTPFAENAALVAPQPSKIGRGKLAREGKFSTKVEIGDLPRDEAARNTLLSRVVLKTLKEGLECAEETFLEVQAAVDSLIATHGIDSAMEKIDDFFNSVLRLIINKGSSSKGVLNTYVADFNKVNFSSLNPEEFSAEVDT